MTGGLTQALSTMPDPERSGDAAFTEVQFTRF